jgi:glutathione S-transferase
MMLIGQYDSPFVRRVAIALKTYGLDFEHQPWSTFGDADQIAEYNPLRRVPTLVLDDGTVLIDSLAILETLDETVGADRAVLNRDGPERRDMLRLASFAAGVADKGVSLVYERVLREAIFPMWVARCRTQIIETLDLLEEERAARATPYLFGAKLSHADVILATMTRFVSEALAGEFDWTCWPALEAHSARCEALAPFKAASQPYTLVKPGED